MNELDRMNEIARNRDDIRRRLEEEALEELAKDEVKDGCRGTCHCEESCFEPVKVEEPAESQAIDDEVEGHQGPLMRKFDTGATRNVDDDNLDYEGFLSPLAQKRYAEYMHEHRRQADGTLRASDNWQKGIPFDSYMKSGFRHFMDWWMNHRELEARDDIETALCALLFNVQGYLHEHLKAK